MNAILVYVVICLRFADAPKHFSWYGYSFVLSLEFHLDHTPKSQFHHDTVISRDVVCRVPRKGKRLRHTESQQLKPYSSRKRYVWARCIDFPHRALAEGRR